MHIFAFSLNTVSTPQLKKTNSGNTKSFYSAACTFCKFIRFRGQNPLHVVGQYGKDTAAAMFELFRDTMPDFPIDKPDNDGNTGR